MIVALTIICVVVLFALRMFVREMFTNHSVNAQIRREDRDIERALRNIKRWR